MPRKLKTEHSGAKRGKGYWGHKQEAKKVSQKQRRVDSKKIIKVSLVGQVPSTPDTRRSIAHR